MVRLLLATDKDRIEILFGGFGGQGIALMGYVLGYSLTVYERKETVHARAYGPESRGGASYSSVIISLRGELPDYPYVREADIAIFMSKEAYHKLITKLRKGGILIVDEDLVEIDDRANIASKVYKVPATRIAEQLGNRIVANMVMLGFLSAVTGVVKLESLKRTITEHIRRFVEINVKALETGYQYGQKMISEGK